MSIAKQIEGYPDYYVSSAGNVWRRHRNEFYLKLRPKNEGRVDLCTNGKVKQLYVYRMVAQAFVPIPEQYQGMSIDDLDVHHIDHNRKNNRASNLQWLTKEEHKKLHSESKVTKQRQSKPKSEETKRKIGAALSKPVMQFTKDGVFVAKYASTMEAQRRTNIANESISSCCRGKYKSAGGYIWKYN